MKFTICYTSKSVKKLTDTEVESIFESTASNNEIRGITGILLYNSGHFFQVLEGEKEEVKKLFYDNIYSDTRHSEVLIVMEKETPVPFFNSYNSKFSLVKTQKEYNDLKKYINANLVSEDSKKFNRLLRPFMMMIDA